MKNVQIGTLNSSVVKNSLNEANKKSPRDKSSNGG